MEEGKSKRDLGKISVNPFFFEKLFLRKFRIKLYLQDVL